MFYNFVNFASYQRFLHLLVRGSTAITLQISEEKQAAVQMQAIKEKRSGEQQQQQMVFAKKEPDLTDTRQSEDGESGESRNRTRHGLVWLCLVVFFTQKKCSVPPRGSKKPGNSSKHSSHPINGHPSSLFASSKQGRKVVTQQHVSPCPVLPKMC